MASKITMFEPHFDGPLFGGECDCDCCGAGADDPHHAGDHADPPESNAGCCPGRTIGLVALGVLTLAVLGVVVSRWRGGDSAPVALSDGE